MQKIIEFFKNILLMIVYPNRILNFFKVKNLDQNSNKFLGNDNVVKIFALVLTIMFVITARYTPATSVESYEIIRVPLTVVLDERYTHFGSPIPSQIDVRLAGNRTEISILLASGSVSAYLDLDVLGVGEFNHVPIRIEGVPSQITATLEPNMISEIKIAQIEERRFPLTFTTNNGYIFEELDNKYNYHISFYPKYVTISGSETTLDDIVEVRAIFDATNVEPTVGSSTHEAIVVANGISGNQITGITNISHPTVEVVVEIYEDLKNVALVVNEDLLNFPRGYRITDITPNITEIMIWGNLDEIGDTIELPYFSFTDLDDNGHITLQIPLPDGVYSETTEVEIQVNYLEPPEESTTHIDGSS